MMDNSKETYNGEILKLSILDRDYKPDLRFEDLYRLDINYINWQILDPKDEPTIFENSLKLFLNDHLEDIFKMLNGTRVDGFKVKMKEFINSKTKYFDVVREVSILRGLNRIIIRAKSGLGTVLVNLIIMPKGHS